jgi:lysylphosphatidylglycerol synthetase-like protein (DUF2156 family)
MRRVVAPAASDVADWVQRFGGSVSHVTSDPRCGRFSAPGIRGLIPFRRGVRCLVGIGDPICDARDTDGLAERFRRDCAGRGLSTVFAAASESFASRCVARGYAAIEFGEELIFDPQRDPRVGADGRELRKKLNRAARAGVIADEHARGFGAREAEREMETVANGWLSARWGPQIFITPLSLFAERQGRRWLCARHGERMIGVLSLLRVQVRRGWVFEHLVALPDAPQGTTELLVTSALDVLRGEGCRYATFGPSTLERLGRMWNVGSYGEAVGRAVFSSTARFFHLQSLSHYRRKFQACAIEPSYLLFHPARFGLCEATGLLRAFNLSLRW